MHLRNHQRDNIRTRRDLVARKSSCLRGRQLRYELLEERRLLSVNQPPINIVPGTQAAIENVPLAFTAYRGNPISVSDPDAGNQPIRVRLEVQHGSLSFAFPAPPGGGLTYVLGDGTNDRVIEVTGSQEIINSAIGWLYYTPPFFDGTQWNGENGASPTFDILTITTDDQGHSGTGGAQQDADAVQIQFERVTFAAAPTWPTLAAAFDTSFDTDGRQTLSVSPGMDYIHDMKELPDGKLLAVGAVNDRFGVLRFNSDLTLDSSFGNGGVVESDFGSGRHALTVEIDHSGRYVVGGIGFVARYLPSGQSDSTFGTNGRASAGIANPIHDIAIEADGKVLTTGSENGQYAVNRYSPDGILEASWVYHGGGHYARAIEADDRGDFLIFGTFSMLRVTRVGVTGVEEGTFDYDLPGGEFYRSSLRLPDGKTLVIGQADSGDVAITRHLQTGMIDPTFGSNGLRIFPVLLGEDAGYRATLQRDGKILVTGHSFASGNSDIFIARMSYDGVLDTTFNSTGTLGISSSGDEKGFAVVSQADGKIVIAGQSGNDLALVRLLGDHDLYAERPGIDAISNQIIVEDQGNWTIDLAGIRSGASGDRPIRVSATSSFPTLIPNPTVQYQSPQSTGQLTIVPTANFTGFSVITVIVEDGGPDADLSTVGDNVHFETCFTVTVTPVNDPPTLDVIDDLEMEEDGGSRQIALAGITAGGNESQPLRVTATSSLPGVIPHPTLNYSSPNSTGTLSFEPLADKNGTVTITVTVEDGGFDNNLGTFEDNATFTRQFQVVVSPVDYPPTDILISSETIVENVPVGTVVATFSSVDPDPEDTHTYSLVDGTGGGHNQYFRIEGNQLITVAGVDWEYIDSYQVRVRSEGSDGLSFEKSFILNVVDLPELHESPVFGDGTNQRSLVKQILITFDEDVDLAEGAFSLVKRGANGGAVTTTFIKRVNSVGRTEVVLSFSGTFTRGASNALVDGNYQLTIDGTKITRDGRMLDINRDSVGGDELVLGDEAADRFFAYYGDLNGDRTISLAELNAMRAAFGKNNTSPAYNPLLDFDQNNLVSLLELNQFRARYGRSLAFA